MIDWSVKHVICGLDELEGLRSEGITHVLSILDPGTPEPGLFFGAMAPLDRLTLHFHDAIIPHPDHVLPTRNDVAALLAFGRGLPDQDPAHLLVHCHMGISRSVAAMTALLIQAHPQADEDDVLDHVRSIRPKAWPNSLMIRHADVLLERQGRLIAASARLYRRQLIDHPQFAEPLRKIGRAAEVEMAEQAQG